MNSLIQITNLMVIKKRTPKKVDKKQNILLGNLGIVLKQKAFQDYIFLYAPNKFLIQI
jgi:hypothetical protein